jgi:hypothetical protein
LAETRPAMSLRATHGAWHHSASNDIRICHCKFVHGGYPATQNGMTKPVIATSEWFWRARKQSPTATKETAFLSLRSGQALVLAVARRLISSAAKESPPWLCNTPWYEPAEGEWSVWKTRTCATVGPVGVIRGGKQDKLLCCQMQAAARSIHGSGCRHSDPRW